MKHIIALLIKFVFVAVVLFSFFTIYNVTFPTIISSILLVAIPAYIIGDLIIFRFFGNIAADVADFILYSAMLYAIVYFTIDRTLSSISTAVFAASLITFCEGFYHPFVINRFFHYRKEEETTPQPIRRTQFSTEYSEEIDPKNSLGKKKDPKDK